ncbi:MAG: CcmD family protein [Ignavibacteriales bacterium]|nr:CcmD family protein [Ignavibacteriales bacterium]
MYDFLASNQLYIVMCIVLINWFGLLAYLFRIDGRLRKLEQSTYAKDEKA